MWGGRLRAEVSTGCQILISGMQLTLLPTPLSAVCRRLALLVSRASLRRDAALFPIGGMQPPGARFALPDDSISDVSPSRDELMWALRDDLAELLGKLHRVWNAVLVEVRANVGPYVDNGEKVVVLIVIYAEDIHQRKVVREPLRRCRVRRRGVALRLAIVCRLVRGRLVLLLGRRRGVLGLRRANHVRLLHLFLFFLRVLLRRRTRTMRGILGLHGVKGPPNVPAPDTFQPHLLTGRKRHPLLGGIGVAVVPESHVKDHVRPEPVVAVAERERPCARLQGLSVSGRVIGVWEDGEAHVRCEAAHRVFRTETGTDEVRCVLECGIIREWETQQLCARQMDPTREGEHARTMPKKTMHLVVCIVAAAAFAIGSWRDWRVFSTSISTTAYVPGRGKKV